MATRAREAEWLAAFLETRRREKARLSRLLHDEIGQILSAVGLQLDLLRMDCEHVSGLAGRIGEVQKLLEKAVAQVRELSYELNPLLVDRIGLEAALERLIALHRKSFSGSLELVWDPGARLPESAARACYQIVEQALEEAVQQAGVHRIEVAVVRKSDGVQIEVCHNAPTRARDGAPELVSTIGRWLIKHYAQTAGLGLCLAHEPGRGTIVRAVYPPREHTAAGVGRRRRGSAG